MIKKYECRTPKDWLTRDEAIVDAYIADERSSFFFTLNAYHAMFTGIDRLYHKDLLSRMPKARYLSIPYLYPIMPPTLNTPITASTPSISTMLRPNSLILIFISFPFYKMILIKHIIKKGTFFSLFKSAKLDF